jgi:hypothetical protein
VSTKVSVMATAPSRAVICVQAPAAPISGEVHLAGVAVGFNLETADERRFRPKD